MEAQQRPLPPGSSSPSGCCTDDRCWFSFALNNWRSHQDFLLILILFVTFRILMVLAFRPGGQVLDYSDFYYFRIVAELSRQGYIPYITMWSPYPPLFPFLMVGIWWLSSLIPPWEFSILWFSVLMGTLFLLFEAGNLILTYAIARQLFDHKKALRPVWLYALLFPPVYTMMGWFDGVALFFFLLSLYLLLRRRPFWSAMVTGVGFMFKLISLLLIPIGLQVINSAQAGNLKGNDHAFFEIGCKLQEHIKLPWPTNPASLRKLLTYGLTFLVTVMFISAPFIVMNPRLAWGWVSINEVRQPWETIWALIEGNFGYGVVPIDLRDMGWNPASSVESSGLPWFWITVAFGLLYLFAYTRRIKWLEAPRVVAFTGFSLTLFLLYSKGYSPQWLGWLLVFVVLLLPNLRGAFYVVVTSVVNIVEGNLFFTILPDEHWLLWLTVGIRTLMLVMLAVEFMLIVQPRWLSTTTIRIRRWVVTSLAVILVIGTIPATYMFMKAYYVARHDLSPYQNTISTLQAQVQPESALVINSGDHNTYDWLYPYLHHRATFFMLDDYAPAGDSVEARTVATLERIAQDHQDWWVYDSHPDVQTESETATSDWLSKRGMRLEQHELDSGVLYHFEVK